MKRALSLALASVLILPALSACEPQEKDIDLPAEIARNLEDAAANLRNNKIKEAEGQYKWILDHEAGNVGALTGMGKVAIAREDYAAAIGPLEQAVAKAADNADTQVTLGRAFAGHKDWTAAAEHLGKAWALDGEQEQFGLEYGVALREAGELAKSAEILLEVGELNPRIQYVYRELGRTQMAAEELDKALRTFMKAQTQWKGDQDSYAGAAMVYEEQGKVTKAADQWAAYIQQDCCSTYSKEVAQPRLAALKKAENAEVPESPEPDMDG